VSTAERPDYACTLEPVTWLLITLYVIAAVSEAVGILLVVLDVRNTRERLRAYTRTVYAYADAAVAHATGSAAAVVVSSHQPSVDERLALLEQERERHAQRHADDEAAMIRRIDAAAENAKRYVHDSISQELRRLVALVTEINAPDASSRLRQWWVGPTLIGIGLVLGLVGNILSAV
jgi:hypothetical protein